MNAQIQKGFHFGLESEYLLVDAETFRPLWYRDVTFQGLNGLLESIDLAGLPSLTGLDLERPHSKLMPYAVEGYHVPDPDLNPIDLLPKGIEIRTPVCDSIEECLACLATLHERLQTALLDLGYQVVALSHHPTETHFEGPQNKRRYDFWQWAMEVMVTYGPDVNISLPADLRSQLDIADLHAKVNYYAPALTALTLASPFRAGQLWKIRGQIGKSVRTYRRSVIAPALEVHLEEDGRLEFKPLEMTDRIDDFHGYFLLWLTILLDKGLQGRASNQSRIYDLGAVARDGVQANGVRTRALEVLQRAPAVLESYGFAPQALEAFQSRLVTGILPADDLIKAYCLSASIPDVLRQRVQLHPEGASLRAAARGA
jgi:hypothetical protein